MIWRWYTGIELMEGIKPHFWLGETEQSINCDARLYVLWPLNHLLNWWRR